MFVNFQEIDLKLNTNKENGAQLIGDNFFLTVINNYSIFSWKPCYKKLKYKALWKKNRFN